MSQNVSIYNMSVEVSATSLDSYGQLIKLLMPRALTIAIYDRNAVPLWITDGVENPDLQEFAQEVIAQLAGLGEQGRGKGGAAREWNGESAYIFVMPTRPASRLPDWTMPHLANA